MLAPVRPLNVVPLWGKSMKHNKKEVERRTAAARAAIKRTLDQGEGEFSVALFVSHHLDELDAAYWKKHAGTPRPSPKKVLDLLVLRSHWGKKVKRASMPSISPFPMRLRTT